MKRQVRFGVFETNSSSTHACAIVTKEEYEKLEKGELFISPDMLCGGFTGGDLLTRAAAEKENENREERYEEYTTFEEAVEMMSVDIEKIEYRTKSGEELVGLSLYSYD